MASAGGYDPGLDYNDDGKIDYMDLYKLAKAYGTSGTPINKTALLLELQSRVDILNASFLDLEAYLETRVTTLEASLVYLHFRVETLENQSLPQGFIRAPAYDSGWVTVPEPPPTSILRTI